jgi:hypothetical protein
MAESMLPQMRASASTSRSITRPRSMMPVKRAFSSTGKPAEFGIACVVDRIADLEKPSEFRGLNALRTLGFPAQRNGCRPRARRIERRAR